MTILEKQYLSKLRRKFPDGKIPVKLFYKKLWKLRAKLYEARAEASRAPGLANSYMQKAIRCFEQPKVIYSTETEPLRQIIAEQERLIQELMAR